MYRDNQPLEEELGNNHRQSYNYSKNNYDDYSVDFENLCYTSIQHYCSLPVNARVSSTVGSIHAKPSTRITHCQVILHLPQLGDYCIDEWCVSYNVKCLGA